ncbi:GspH/FimT family pseudopilin [Thalassomonas sp. RHCl1]|uniref:GspH/FimT family pseudopilin n=1 Tax=Thalassomonas sp. RHCl1 TaxID=2995320 RepID=UPI00248D2C44|nr:GspH/FimT family pseudopilin [Thalassomonas sp. RHCl1]
MHRQSGITLFELMFTVAILGILTAIALPNFGSFTAQLRVDNEISELHRLLLVARNNAINLGQNVTVCPLNASSSCDGDWQDQVSVFTDSNNNQKYEATLNEQLIKVKGAVSSGDLLQYSRDALTYTPAGRTTGLATGTFDYCPHGYNDLSRGIVVASSGRAYVSSDIDNDGKDESRSGSEITCS